MCTVTLIQTRCSQTEGHSVRLMCNRDELRTRPACLPPVLRMCNDLTALMPLDALSLGTWIGVNQAGLIACLLNLNQHPSDTPPDSSDRPVSSRGRIVPAVLACEGLQHAADRFNEFLLPHTSPFRLLLCDLYHHATIIWDGDSLSIGRPRRISAPIMLTSSGLGDQIVQGPRQSLFERMFAPGADPDHAQQQFHAHRWDDAGYSSVLMSRKLARTRSTTTITLTDTQAQLVHTPFNDDLLPASAPCSRSLAIGSHHHTPSHR